MVRTICRRLPRGKTRAHDLIAISLTDTAVIVGADGKAVYMPDPENGNPAAVTRRLGKIFRRLGGTPHCWRIRQCRSLSRSG